MSNRKFLNKEEIEQTAIQRGPEALFRAFGIDTAKYRISGKEYIGPSPLRADSTGKNSFHISTDKLYWHDMVSGKGGDVFDFVADFLSLDRKRSFRQVLERLDECNGGTRGSRPPPAQTSKTKIEEKEKNQANPPLKIELTNLNYSVPFLTDARERDGHGFQLPTLLHFGVGFYESAGYHQNRIVYPVHDVGGVLVGYIGRVIEENPTQKYFVPPNFRKSLEVYNLHRLNPKADNSDPSAVDETQEHGLIVVEGFHDVMSLYEQGYLNCVALMGNTMSEAQEKLIFDHNINPTGEVWLMLDGNQGGMMSQKTLTDRLLKRGRSVYSVTWPQRLLDAEKTEPEHLTVKDVKSLVGY